jgi:hypothetical protein
MRIDEFKFQDFLNRGSDFKGDTPDTAGVPGAISGSKKSGLSREDQLTQDIFVKKFVTRGLNSIKTAVEQGIVDLNAGAEPAQPAADQSQPTASQTQPAAGKTPQPGTQADAAASVKKGQAPGNQAIATGQKQGVAKPAIDQQVDKLVSAMRKFQPTGTKPLPAEMKDEIDPATGENVKVRVPTSKIEKEIVADMDKVALNKDYLLRVADRIQKANAQGYDVKDAHTKFMGQLAKGMKNKSIQEARMFEILVRLVNEAQFRQQVRESGHDPKLVITRFRTLLENSTNEGILDKVKGFFGKKPAAQPAAGAAAPAQQAAAPATPAASGKPSLGQWFKDTFMTNFLKGINLDAAMPQIQKMLDNMGKSYQSGNIAKDLQNIAMIAFAQSDMGKTQDKKTAA